MAYFPLINDHCHLKQSLPFWKGRFPTRLALCVTKFHVAIFSRFKTLEMVVSDNNFALKDLIEFAIEEVETKRTLFESTNIEKEQFLATLPDDCFYHVTPICGNEAQHKVHFLTEEITEENLQQWQWIMDSI